MFFFLIDILLGFRKMGDAQRVCVYVYIYNMHMGTISLVSTMAHLRFQISFSAFPQGFPMSAAPLDRCNLQLLDLIQEQSSNPPTCRAHLKTPRTTGRKINCEDHMTSYNDMESFSKTLETWRGFQAACKTRDLTIFSTPNPADQDFQVGQAI